MSPEHERDAPPYWNDDRELTTLVVARHERLVHVRSHIEHERYAGRGSESLFALAHPRGERTYVQSRLYFHAPEGTSREQRLADGQAWFYGAETPPAIVLWELVPAAPHVWSGGDDPREDFPLRSLWLSYERYLAERFPSAERFLTTWEDTYERPAWEGFLRTVGYAHTAPALFSKPVERLPRP